MLWEVRMESLPYWKDMEKATAAALSRTDNKFSAVTYTGGRETAGGHPVQRRWLAVLRSP